MLVALLKLSSGCLCSCVVHVLEKEDGGGWRRIG
jgi:hypothetical protein